MPNKYDKFWPLLLVAGAIPGLVLWLLLVRLTFAGEYAGLVVGFGAATTFGYFGCKYSKKRIAIGCLIIIMLAVITNHLGYAMDIFFTFGDSYYGMAGEKLTFMGAVKKAFDVFVVKNTEGLRKFYIEAMMQGILCSCLLWLVLTIYALTDKKVAEEKE